MLKVATDRRRLLVWTLNRQLLGWEHTCNCVRPHQALGYLTRLEFVKRWKRSVQNQRCH